jgi:hypothetical protein
MWQRRRHIEDGKKMYSLFKNDAHMQASTHPVFAELTEMFSFGFLAYLQRSSRSHLYEGISISTEHQRWMDRTKKMGIFSFILLLLCSVP